MLHRLRILVYRMRHPRWIFAFRRIYWRLLGMEVGSGACLGKINVSWPHSVSIGAGCLIEDGVRFKVDGPYTPNRRINIGDNVFIGSATEFNIQEEIHIGKDCLIASGCRFIDNNHGRSLDLPIREQPNTAAKIDVGPGCWLGAGVIVLSGVAIGESSIIGAGAVVTRDLPTRTKSIGVPAKVISTAKASTSSLKEGCLPAKSK